MPETDLVCVVDDDAAARNSVRMLIESLGVEVRTYESGEMLLADTEGMARCGCLVLDVRMRGMSGLAVQESLLKHGHTAAIVFVSGHADVPMAVKAIKRGAQDFLTKPFRHQDLLEQVTDGLARWHGTREQAVKREIVAARLRSLTAREHEVLHLILRGHMNKTIATELGISDKTVEDHRARVMRKMHARSIVQLALMGATAGLV